MKLTSRPPCTREVHVARQLRERPMVSQRRFSAIAGAMAAGRSVLALCIPLLMLSAHPGHAQSAGTIKLIVPGPPGAANDILARVLAGQIERAEGATLIV